MNILCIGGGPAALYFSICMKLLNSSYDISVIERNPIGYTHGWGIILPDKIIRDMMEHDPKSALKIKESLIHWEKIAVYFKETHTYLGGHHFSAIGRQKLLDILQERAKELKIKIHFNQEITPGYSLFSDADLIVASDGASSKTRNFFAEHFKVTMDKRPNKYKWLGTAQRFKHAFTFIFEKTPHGWIWAHCYQFDLSTSTFLIECSEETWRGLGFEFADEATTLKICEKIFEKHLDGHILTNKIHYTQSPSWINFPLVKCQQWYYKNIVLLGDAAHTAHFSIGSGTRLALEDAIFLAKTLNTKPSLKETLKEYQDIRRPALDYLVNASLKSMTWFENLEYYTMLHPLQFLYSLIVRSQAISHEEIRSKDPQWLESIEHWFCEENREHPVIQSTEPTLPIHTPFKLGTLKLKNRIVLKKITSIATPVKNTSYEPGLILIEIPELANPFLNYRDMKIHMKKAISSIIQTNNDVKVGLQLIYKAFKNDSTTLIKHIKQQYLDCTKTASESGFHLLSLDCDLIFLLQEEPHKNSSMDRLSYLTQFIQTIRHSWPNEKPILLKLPSIESEFYLNEDPQKLLSYIETFKTFGIDIIDFHMKKEDLFSKGFIHKINLPRIAADDELTINEMNSLIITNKIHLCYC